MTTYGLGHRLAPQAWGLDFPAPRTDRGRGNARTRHDDLPFEELARRYNFRLTSGLPAVFTRLVVEECRRRVMPVRVLEIGCGRGMARRPDYQWAIRRHADELWGVEPDETVAPPDGLFDGHQHASMESATLPDGHFDVVYSHMVMEHVADPQRFMQCVTRCLKPGGSYIFATPNRKHYFTRIASLLHRVGLDELVLRLVKGRRAEEYHYPVEYRFNDKGVIDGCARRLGLLPPEFAYVESDGPRGYLPGPLRVFFHLLALKRKLIRRPEVLLGLICRITKPQAAAARVTRRRPALRWAHRTPGSGRTSACTAGSRTSRRTAPAP